MPGARANGGNSRDRTRGAAPISGTCAGRRPHRRPTRPAPAPYGAESCIPGVLAIFTPYLDRPRPPAAPETPDVERLSDREFAVLRLTAAGRTIPEISRELDLSPYTVKSRVARIHHKLGARTRAGCDGLR